MNGRSPAHSLSGSACAGWRAAAAFCVTSPSAASASVRRAPSAAIRAASPSSFGGQFACNAHADDLMRRERARTQAALMPAAVNLRGDLIRDIAAHEQRADALSGRTPCARTSTACRCRARARRSASCRLRGVDVEQRARVMHDARDCANIGQRAEFVVHEHQRHEARIGADGGSDRVGGDLAVARGREERDRRAVLRQVRHRVENGLVLDAARDQVALAGRVFRIALQREVVRFGGARRPDDLVGVRADQRGDLRAGLLDLVFREPAGGMRADAGLPKMPSKPRQAVIASITRGSAGVVAA